ncbi:zinc finger protein zas1 [Schizosaccharomyces octosporus yFS286]|uniref:Zinc finger protein zas1 n=1 Tax=Schizosaccharomyces octosporus (strain yFS286) TaxID=483514 RepID=S9PRA2_SCHOY|nr:zinc finger protein zas1 [Schizosaccharomyces octosporus yFS286]EPX71701.1 zinc finger protein zas1 [Schizosaccharomyces octosporus yFS286]
MSIEPQATSHAGLVDHMRYPQISQFLHETIPSSIQQSTRSRELTNIDLFNSAQDPSTIPNFGEDLGFQPVLFTSSSLKGGPNGSNDSTSFHGFLSSNMTSPQQNTNDFVCWIFKLIPESSNSTNSVIPKNLSCIHIDFANTDSLSSHFIVDKKLQSKNLIRYQHTCY